MAEETSNEEMADILSPNFEHGNSAEYAHTPASFTSPPDNDAPASPGPPMRSGTSDCVQVNLHRSTMETIYGIVAPKVVRYENHRYAVVRILLPTEYGTDNVTVEVEGIVNLYLKLFIFY